VFTISNHHQEIVETNYWGTERARNGVFYLSWNAGAARLLVPSAQTPSIAEMRSAKYVVISQGKDRQNGWRDVLELMFEDHTDTPFCIVIGGNQTDRLLPAADQRADLIFTVWTEKGEQLSIPGKYRQVKGIPCMKPWSDHP